MKRTLAIVLAIAMTLALCVGLAGCGEEATNNETVYNVGILQLVQHDALDAATKGFRDALTEKLGDNVKFDEQNAANDSATCATIAGQFVAADVDLIMANATPALQAAVAATDTIPIVATSITDYGTALEIADWTGTTGMNVTGTADLAPLDEQAAMIKELVPDVKTVGILYASSEPNSKYQADVVTGYLEEMGIEVKEYTCSDSNDLALVATSACEEVDVIYVPTDNTMASNAEIVDNIALDAGVPVVAGEAGICKGCGIATLSIDYYSIGYAAGEQAYEILVNGADPATMEIGFATDLTKQYIASRCQALQIEVPTDYEEIVVE